MDDRLQASVLLNACVDASLRSAGGGRRAGGDASGDADSWKCDVVEGPPSRRRRWTRSAGAWAPSRLRYANTRNNDHCTGLWILSA